MPRTDFHAKTVMWGARQVLCWFVRNEDDRLCVNLQLWVEVTDEQLQVRITPNGEEEAHAAFDMIDENTIGSVLEQLGVPSLLDQFENDT